MLRALLREWAVQLPHARLVTAGISAPANRSTAVRVRLALPAARVAAHARIGEQCAHAPDCGDYSPGLSLSAILQLTGPLLSLDGELLVLLVRAGILREVSGIDLVPRLRQWTISVGLRSECVRGLWRGHLR